MIKNETKECDGIEKCARSRELKSKSFFGRAVVLVWNTWRRKQHIYTGESLLMTLDLEALLDLLSPLASGSSLISSF